MKLSFLVVVSTLSLASAQAFHKSCRVPFPNPRIFATHLTQPQNFRLTANKRLGCQCKNKQGIWKNNEFDLNMVLGVEKGALVYKRFIFVSGPSFSGFNPLPFLQKLTKLALRWGMYYDICYGVDIIDVSKDYGIGWEAFCGRMEINGKWYDYPSRIMLCKCSLYWRRVVMNTHADVVAADFIGNIDGCLKDRNFGMEARCW